MNNTTDILVPDIGDFNDVEIIEVLVSEGQKLAKGDPIITLESDKASMEIPTEIDGEVSSLYVSVGDKVSQGTKIAALTSTDQTNSNINAKDTLDNKSPSPAASASDNDSDPVNKTLQGFDASNATQHQCNVVVLGSGPGGYTAAFRAADLGLDVILVERYPNLGGVCLNVGCIPSKALLHTAEIINNAESLASHGVSFAKPDIEVDKLAKWKSSVVSKLTGGLKALAKQRKVRVVHGLGQFYDGHQIAVTDGTHQHVIRFNHAIIAAGSQSVKLPAFPHEDPRLIDSTGALELEDIPQKLLVIGGGIIGLEMACVYTALGSRVTIVELTNTLIPGCDRDLVRPLQMRLKKQCEKIYTGTKVTAIDASDKNYLKVSFEGKGAPANDNYDKVLLSIGRRPNGLQINAEAAGVNVDDRGFITVNKQMQTNIQHIYAIGDIVGQPMLAHKATHEGKVAAEVIAGHKASFDAITIPSVAYTDPEVAWCGVTEEEAKAKGISYEKGVFPWAASGRALSLGRGEGMTKLLFDKETNRVIGCGIVGVHAGDLIAEAALAIEMGADMEDLALTIHPHPTLSETLNFASEVAQGTVTDIYAPKR